MSNALHPILVVGGAGYIGSHMVRYLQDRNQPVIVLDNLCTGNPEAVAESELVITDLGNQDMLEQLFTSHSFRAIMHFAAHSQVAESIQNPALYYENNVAQTITLLNALIAHQPDIPFIFSSSAAIYGAPTHQPITEDTAAAPISPYGRSKWMVEQLLHDYHRAYGLPVGCLRYFNAAGAHPTGTLGENRQTETHLIPLIMQVASGRRPFITLYGDDYATKDGTCIRDCIHVCDLVEAHALLLDKLTQSPDHLTLNLGTSSGYSVLEILHAARTITGQPIPAKTAPRRAGDPATLIADGTRAHQLLGWKPTRSDLHTILADAWRWEQQLASSDKLREKASL